MSSEAGTRPHRLAVAVQPRALVACHTERKQRFEFDQRLKFSFHSFKQKESPWVHGQLPMSLGLTLAIKVYKGM